MSVAQFACAEKNWHLYLNLRQNDASAWAKLGIASNQNDDHEAAIAAFEHAVKLGEGTYDLFAYYADSLANLGRTQDAVDWYYKSLTVVPSLVDVRGKLAKLLILQERHYEALSLLESFDARLQAQGLSPYFEGQRIAIETALKQGEARTQETLRLPKYESHFYAPVSIGDSRPEVFMVDTGASMTMMDEMLLSRSRARYSEIQTNAMFQTADGRATSAKIVVLESMKVGPYALNDVQVAICRRCISLLGQSTLSKFDLKSSKVNEVEFMTLSPRFAAVMKVEGKGGASKLGYAKHATATSANRPYLSPRDDIDQVNGAARPSDASGEPSALGVARKCLDLDESLANTKRHLDEAAKAAKAASDRIQQEGRELAEIRKGLGSAHESTVDAYNRRIEAHNQAIDLASERADQFNSEQDRFNDAVQSRNEMCSNFELNDHEYQLYKKEKDARRKAAVAPEVSTTSSDVSKP
jgi:clan AA aspartic protease (TIGR02281 family)